jgi:hypothetical protein
VAIAPHPKKDDMSNIAQTLTKIWPICIYAPDHEEYIVRVLGAKIMPINNCEYHLKLECLLSNGDRILLSTSELEELFIKYAIPF